MIPYEDALAAVMAAVKPLPPESVPLEKADGRVLARGLRSRFDLPRFDQSAMDGYAVRRADVAGASARSPRTLRVIGEMPAGGSRMLRLRKGCAVRVFTGSRLPHDTSAVVIQEDCDLMGDRVAVRHAADVGENLRFRGEELRRGDPLLSAGAVITPPVAGLLAFHGIVTVRVHRVPDVTVITLGDELLAPDAPLAPGRIRDANGPSLSAALRGLPVGRVRTARVGDDPRVLKRRLARALRESDVVITAGGASVGDHDHVEAVRAELGVREAFTRVKVKPGKPVVFGTAPDGKPLFGLPGNPVSALVSFHQFARPALLRLAGRAAEAAGPLRAELAETIVNTPGRLTWWRGRLEIRDGRRLVHPTRGQGSHMLSGLAGADALIVVPDDVRRLKKGATVFVQPLAWNRP